MNRIVNHRLYKGFWQIADPKIWVASTIPMLIAIALAYTKQQSLDFGWIVIAFVGIYLIEIGKNAVNDFIDYWTGVDRFVTADKRNPFSGGKKVIIDGKLSMLETAIIAFVTIGLAFFVGLYISIFREPNVFWIGMIGGFLAVFYSLPPFKFNYTGLGEAAIGVTFGPLMITGMYVMLTGELDWKVAIVGLPIMFFTIALIWVNQYPDFEADKQGGKRNWLVRIGKEKGIKVYLVLFVIAYLSIIMLPFVTGNFFWLLGLVSLPMALKAVKIAANNLDNLPQFLAANGKTVLVLQLSGVMLMIAAFFSA